MNVNDVTEVPEVKTGQTLKLIFARQRELMEKYEQIEAANGLLQTPDIPVDLNDAKGQARLKDFAWRVVEELAEAREAAIIMLQGLDDDPEAKADLTHVHEELMDTLHFLVEMSILSGITPEDMKEIVTKKLLKEDGFSLDEDQIDMDILELLSNDLESVSIDLKFSFNDLMVEFIQGIGMVCHLLKNKPWKQSQMLTDVAEYKDRFTGIFLNFIALCIYTGMSAESIFNLYFRKSEVNKFRQRSNY